MVCLHFFVGKNPRNTKFDVSKQAHTTHKLIAVGPGNISKSNLSFQHILIISLPGSDIPGIPASDTNPTFCSDINLL